MLIALALFVLHLIAIVEILVSKEDVGYKLLWTLLVILLPIVGMLLYYLIGRDQRTQS